MSDTHVGICIRCCKKTDILYGLCANCYTTVEDEFKTTVASLNPALVQDFEVDNDEIVFLNKEDIEIGRFNIVMLVGKFLKELANDPPRPAI